MNAIGQKKNFMRYELNPVCGVAQQGYNSIYFLSAASRESKSVAGAVFMAEKKCLNNKCVFMFECMLRVCEMLCCVLIRFVMCINSHFVKSQLKCRIGTQFNIS